MNSIILYEEMLLLEYNLDTNNYVTSYDDGRSFPYEFYENVEIDNQDYYLIFLEEQDAVPTTSYDKWLKLDEAISFLKEHISANKDQEESKKLLDLIFKINNKELI